MSSFKNMLVTVILFATSGLGYAATSYHVWRDNPIPTPPFTNWAMAATSIQDAVDLTLSGDTVLVTNGTYDTGGAITPSYALTNRVCINSKSVTIRSMNGPAVTIIKGAPDGVTGGCGDAAIRGIYMTAGTLDGFTLADGYTKTNGNNEYDKSGAGVFLSGGAVSNCLISQNTAKQYGGGAFFKVSGTMNNCTLNSNTAGYGGGGVFTSGGGTVNSCTLSNNRALAYGGGTWMADGTINNSMLVSNSAVYYGGGVYFSSGNGVLNNCLLIGNFSDLSAGGGVYFNGCGRANNCTVAATKSGGGAWLENGGAMTNGIVWGNNWNVYVNTAGAISYSCASGVLTNWGVGNTTNNPLFVDTNTANYHLSANSPCVNTGINQDWMTNSVDMDGKIRIRYRTVDMGAYEAIYKGTVFTVF